MEAIRKSLDSSFSDALERVKSVFKDHGFGTLSEIDVKSTLKDKIGVEIEPYTILGVCNPQIASRAIGAEHEVGVMLPCTVLVHECGGKANVCAQDPLLMIEVVGEKVRPMAQEAHDRIAAAVAAL